MPRVVDHDERRREITVAAMALIEKSGTRAVTMRSLATHLGVANGALDRYFPGGKDAIMDAAYTAASALVRRHVRARARAHEPGLESLRTAVTALLPLAGQVEGAAALLAFWTEPADTAGIGERVGHDLADLRDRIEASLRAAAAEGQVTHPERIATAALALVALVSGSHHVHLTMPGLAAAEGYADAVDLVLAAI